MGQLDRGSLPPLRPQLSRRTPARWRDGPAASRWTVRGMWLSRAAAVVRRRAATIILRKRRRIGLQCALLRSQTICSTMLGTRQLLLVEVPHARMRSEWHQLRRQLMQQQQHGKSNELYSNIPHCLRRAADPPFYPVSWVPTPPLSGKAAVYSSGSARAQRTRERKK